MLSRLSSHQCPHRSRFGPSVRAAPTMPSADFCRAVRTSSPVLSRSRVGDHDTGQISRGKTRILPRVDAGFTKCTLVGVATDVVHGGLDGHMPAGPECTSPRDDALALWLTFGSTHTWCQDFHPTGFVQCTTHTFKVRGGRPKGGNPEAQLLGRPLDRRVGRLSVQRTTP